MELVLNNAHAINKMFHYTIYEWYTYRYTIVCRHYSDV